MEQNHHKNEIQYIRISYVEQDRQQPRKIFDEEKIDELAASIKKYGVIEPIVVQKMDGYYKIIAGERRWRASCKAGLKEVPVIIRDIGEKEAAEISLVENLHREDLTPIEEAVAYKNYCEKYKVSKQELADILTKSRSSVSHAIRLLQLPDSVQKMIEDGTITTGHGKVILLADENKREAVAKEIARKKMNVREAERYIKKINRTKIEKRTDDIDYYMKQIEDVLTERVGSKVQIKREKTKGVVMIEFYDDDGLEKIYNHLMKM